MKLPHLFSKASILAAAITLCCAGPARAVPVTPGGATVALPGTTSAEHPEYAGVVLADVNTPWVSIIDPLYGFPGATGTLQSRVVRESSTGTLDFYWRISVAPPSYPGYVPQQLTLTGLSLASFLTGAAFDADYRTDGLGTTAPSGAFSSSAGSFTYQFSPSSFGPGSSSFFLMLHSNATDYDSAASATVGVTTVSTFAPVAAIPEPSSWLLLGAGLGAVALTRRRARAEGDPTAAPHRP